MGGAISPEEQRAIEAFLAKQQVTVIPAGAVTDPEVKIRTNVGRPRNHAAVRRVKFLASLGWLDRDIAHEIGKTRSAVSNIRFRYGIIAGINQRGDA